MAEQALLMLDDGTCFEGEACGAAGETLGETVFVTGMAGYQESITDPSYYGQIMVFTAAHLGNYGASPLDDEAPKPLAAGVVFHDLFRQGGRGVFPHWRAVESLDAMLRRNGVTGITNVDTRSLALHLRDHGSRNGIISALDRDRASLLRKARQWPSMQGRDLAREAGAGPVRDYTPTEDGLPVPDLHTVLIDYGAKRSIAVRLARQGMKVTVMPATARADEVLALGPDGVLLSNGPGDPEPCSYAVECIRGLLGRLPVFGICLGHQLLGLALGGRTYKLPFGHHGVNHPVLDRGSGRVEITSQNHGFCVDPDSLPPEAEATHVNLNDGTLEGLRLRDKPVFSVQFHPEATPGTHDAGGLFARFRAMILEHREALRHAQAQ
ncbi:MAG: glutamine-hydrolyzing carbamoyl-phosphate synthase small subunit [Desulfovibrio sp.]|jgi:carbamoyl-phosphate synthase small subunit|nr:glutamine-hydrolyzing carbamoyl-phosphate synthase small subunit [Desulfovibrio sp.]